MKASAILSIAVMIVVAVLWGAPGDRAPAQVEIARLTEANWSEFAPDGKEVDAIAGDYVLRNQFLSVVIAQPLDTRHANMTIRQVAGALIDLTTRSKPSDQLGAYFPGKRDYPYRSWKVVSPAGEAIDLTRETDVKCAGA